MSQHSVTIVDLDVRGGEAEKRAVVVRDWLIETGVIVPNTERDDLWQPSAFAAGPNAALAFPGYEADQSELGVLANSGVDISSARAIYHPVGNEEPPSCPACGAELDDEENAHILNEWIESGEPKVGCSSCGVASLIGDWPGEWTYHVGELAVTFNNWPPLSDAFVEDVGRRLGDRWRVVKQHV